MIDFPAHGPSAKQLLKFQTEKDVHDRVRKILDRGVCRSGAVSRKLLRAMKADAIGDSSKIRRLLDERASGKAGMSEARSLRQARNTIEPAPEVGGVEDAPCDPKEMRITMRRAYAGWSGRQRAVADRRERRYRNVPELGDMSVETTRLKLRFCMRSRKAAKYIEARRECRPWRNLLNGWHLFLTRWASLTFIASEKVEKFRGDTADVPFHFLNHSSGSWERNTPFAREQMLTMCREVFTPRFRLENTVSSGLPSSLITELEERLRVTLRSYRVTLRPQGSALAPEPQQASLKVLSYMHWVVNQIWWHERDQKTGPIPVLVEVSGRRLATDQKIRGRKRVAPEKATCPTALQNAAVRRAQLELMQCGDVEQNPGPWFIGVWITVLGLSRHYGRAFTLHAEEREEPTPVALVRLASPAVRARRERKRMERLRRSAPMPVTWERVAVATVTDGEVGFSATERVLPPPPAVHWCDEPARIRFFLSEGELVLPKFSGHWFPCRFTCRAQVTMVTHDWCDPFPDEEEYQDLGADGYSRGPKYHTRHDHRNPLLVRGPADAGGKTVMVSTSTHAVCRCGRIVESLSSGPRPALWVMMDGVQRGIITPNISAEMSRMQSLLKEHTRVNFESADTMRATVEVCTDIVRVNVFLMGNGLATPEAHRWLLYMVMCAMLVLTFDLLIVLPRCELAVRGLRKLGLLPSASGSVSWTRTAVSRLAIILTSGICCTLLPALSIGSHVKCLEYARTKRHVSPVLCGINSGISSK